MIVNCAHIHKDMIHKGVTFTCSGVELCILPFSSLDVDVGVGVASVISEGRRLVKFRLQKSVKQHCSRDTEVFDPWQLLTGFVGKQPYSTITVVSPLDKVYWFRE